MRKMFYLSPSSLKMFYSNRDGFYCQYLSELKPPRAPQTQPMAAGSAFDAYAKSYLVEKLIGKHPDFQIETILKAQVEAHNLDWAREHGKIIFDAYMKYGAMADILLDLQNCIGKPKFELTVQGYVKGQLGTVPFLGKPDLYFMTSQSARVVHDFKVNGYCSNSNISPKAGYVRMRTGDSTNGKRHPKAMVMPHNGVSIAASHPMDTVEKDWAAQCSIYAWLLGEDIGAQFIVAIDQIACSNDGMGNKELRIAQHRSIVNSKFQYALFEAAIIAWDAVQREHPFFELTKKESDEKCRLLDLMISAPRDTALEELLR